MDHVLKLAGCSVDPVKQALLNFIKINKKELSPIAEAEFDLLNYEEPEEVVPTKDNNLVSLMLKKPICK